MKSPNKRKKYHIKAYGCQMNRSDGERIAAVLEREGYEETSGAETADLVLFVACSVRQSAMNRIYGQAAKISRENKSGKEKMSALTGCLLDADRKVLSEKFDVVFDIKDLADLPEMISRAGAVRKTPPPESYFHIAPLCKSSFSAYVPVMTGCDNFCSYCAVPYVRGREESRPMGEIISETENMIARGYREIVLLGQNVNSYGGTPRGAKFPKLLREINAVPGKFWIRFLTSHPKDMSGDLIKAMAECEKICEYLHLPAQSGDDSVLKAMNRKYTVERYKALISEARKMIPGLSVSTDIIVGFPGETEKQFENTAALMEEIGYDMAYIAQYSPRPQTAAYAVEDDVPKEEKKRREKRLTGILEKTALENNKRYVGREVEILIDGKRNGFASGKTRTFKNVRVAGGKKIRTGAFVRVEITGVTAWGLEGRAK